MAQWINMATHQAKAAGLEGDLDVLEFHGEAPQKSEK
jgi:hypothetical protein